MLMKETEADREVRDGAFGVAADELRQFIERWERLDAEKTEIADQQKKVMAKAKRRGYDTKIIRKVIALRKRDKEDIAEEEAILDMYRAALGMQGGFDFGDKEPPAPKETKRAKAEARERSWSDGDLDRAMEWIRADLAQNPGKGLEARMVPGVAPHETAALGILSALNDRGDLRFDLSWQVFCLPENETKSAPAADDSDEALVAAGRAAFEAGRGLEDNPFDSDGGKAQAWQDGWFRAEAAGKAAAAAAPDAEVVPDEDDHEPTVEQVIADGEIGRQAEAEPEDDPDADFQDDAPALDDETERDGGADE